MGLEGTSDASVLFVKWDVKAVTEEWVLGVQITLVVCGGTLKWLICRIVEGSD